MKDGNALNLASVAQAQGLSRSTNASKLMEELDALGFAGRSERKHDVLLV